MSTKLSRRNSHVDVLPGELPSVPDAFMHTEYAGWLEERIKRFQLKVYQKTQAERVAVLRQINQLQAECLTLARNEANWRRFPQEDRIRQKRLDLEETELDWRMEDLLFERERKRLDRLQTGTRPKSRDAVEGITGDVEEAIRTQLAVKALFDKARAAHPDLEMWLNEWQAKLEWDLREKK